SGTTTTTPVQGIATFPGLNITTAGTGYTIIATSPGLASATSLAFGVTAPSIRLVFVTPPGPAIAGTAISPTVRVAIQDSLGTTLTSATSAVTLSIAANPGAVTLSGTRTVNAVNGVASFPGIALDRAGVGYKLAASAPGSTGATSPAFDVSGPPARLSFTVQPTHGVVAVPLAPVKVRVEDASGSLVRAATSPIALSLGTNPGLAVLAGGSAVTPVSGIATFAGLSLDRVSVGNRLLASSPGLTSATSILFDVTGPASKLEVMVPPTSGVAGVPIAPAVQVAVKDASGNVVRSATATVAIGLAANPTGAVLSGTRNVTPVNGVASFATLVVDRAGTGYTFTTSATGLQAATSAPFSMSASPQHLAWVRQANATVAGYQIDASAVAATADGGSVVTGHFERAAQFDPGRAGEKWLTSAGLQDAYVARYRADGSLVWVKSIGGTEYDSGTGVAVLADGTILATGTFQRTSTFGAGEAVQTVLSAISVSGDVYLARYSATGALLWAKPATSASAGSSVGSRAVAPCTTDGSVVLTGTFTGSVTFGPGAPAQVVATAPTGATSAFVARFGPDGTLVWVKTTHTSAPYAVSASGVAANADGSTTVTGFMMASATFGAGETGQRTLTTVASQQRCFVARYRFDGQLSWALTVDGESRGTRIAATPDGGAAVTGWFAGTATFGSVSLAARNGSRDVFVAHWSPAGALDWARSAGDDTDDEGNGVAAFADGSLVVVGTCGPFPQFGSGEAGAKTLSLLWHSLVYPGDVFIARYRSDGTFICAHGGGPNSFGRAVAAGADGSSVFVGQAYGTSVMLGVGEPGATTLTRSGGTFAFIVKHGPPQ
ncbi:MAG: hypothetical protein ACAI25_11100, partial [Planctomycetota bacterium]